MPVVTPRRPTPRSPTRAATRGSSSCTAGSSPTPAASTTGAPLRGRSMPADGAAPRIWAHRAFAETAAARHYEQLAVGLRDHQPASQFVWELRDAAADERRHSALCRDLAIELGWRGALPGASAAAAPAPGSL